MDIQKVVKAYIAHGHKWGFASAECMLNKFTPGIMDSKCYQVPFGMREEFVKALKSGSAFKQPTTSAREKLPAKKNLKKRATSPKPGKR